MAMDKKIKKLWVKALRSGRYKQTERALRDVRGYCCLGVLCRVVGAKSFTNQDGERAFWWKDKANANAGLLPMDLRKAMKITPKQQEKLTRLNDGSPNGLGPPVSGVDFKTIADYIEAKL